MRGFVIFKRVVRATSQLPTSSAHLRSLAVGILALAMLAMPAFGLESQHQPHSRQLDAARSDADVAPLVASTALVDLAEDYLAILLQERDDRLSAPEPNSLTQEVREGLDIRTSSPARVGVAIGYAPSRAAAIRDMLGRNGHGPALLDPTLTHVGLAWREVPAAQSWLITDFDAPTGTSNLQGQVIVVAITAGSGS